MGNLVMFALVMTLIAPSYSLRAAVGIRQPSSSFPGPSKSKSSVQGPSVSKSGGPQSKNGLDIQSQGVNTGSEDSSGRQSIHYTTSKDPPPVRPPKDAEQRIRSKFAPTESRIQTLRKYLNGSHLRSAQGVSEEVLRRIGEAPVDSGWSPAAAAIGSTKRLPPQGDSRYPMTCPQPRPRQYHTAVAIAGDIYVFGGLLDSDSGLYTQRRAASVPGGTATVDPAAPVPPALTSDVWSCNSVTSTCNMLRPTLQYCQAARPTIAHARPQGMPPPPADNPHPVFDRDVTFVPTSNQQAERARDRLQKGMRAYSRGYPMPRQVQGVPVSQALPPSKLKIFDPTAYGAGGSKQGGVLLAQLQGQSGFELHSQVIHGLASLDVDNPLGMAGDGEDRQGHASSRDAAKQTPLPLGGGDTGSRSTGVGARAEGTGRLRGRRMPFHDTKSMSLLQSQAASRGPVQGPPLPYHAAVIDQSTGIPTPRSPQIAWPVPAAADALWAFKMGSFQWEQPVTTREVHDQAKWARELLCGTFDQVKERTEALDKAISGQATAAKLAATKDKRERRERSQKLQESTLKQMKGKSKGGGGQKKGSLLLLQSGARPVPMSVRSKLMSMVENPQVLQARKQLLQQAESSSKGGEGQARFASSRSEAGTSRSATPEDPAGANDMLPQVTGALAPWLPNTGNMPEDSEAPASKPVPRWLHTAVAVNGGIVVFGGVSRGWELLGDAWFFDPSKGNERWYCLWGCPPAVYAFVSPETGLPQLSVGLTAEQLEQLQKAQGAGELKPGETWYPKDKADEGGSRAGAATGGASLGLLPFAPGVLPREGHSAVSVSMTLPSNAVELKPVPPREGAGPGTTDKDNGLRTFKDIGIEGAPADEVMIVHGGLGPGSDSVVTMQETLAFIPTPTPKWYRLAGPPTAKEIVAASVGSGASSSSGDGSGSSGLPAVPPPRWMHSAVVLQPVGFGGKRVMVVYGGCSPSMVALNDVWVLSLGKLTWQQLTPTGAPPRARWLHVAVAQTTLPMQPTSRNQPQVYNGEDGDLFDAMDNLGGLAHKIGSMELEDEQEALLEEITAKKRAITMAEQQQKQKQQGAGGVGQPSLLQTGGVARMQSKATTRHGSTSAIVPKPGTEPALVTTLGFDRDSQSPGLGFEDGTRYEEICMEAYGLRLSEEGEGDEEDEEERGDDEDKPVGALFGVPQLPATQMLVRGGANQQMILDDAAVLHLYVATAKQGSPQSVYDTKPWTWTPGTTETKMGKLQARWEPFVPSGATPPPAVGAAAVVLEASDPNSVLPGVRGTQYTIYIGGGVRRDDVISADLVLGQHMHFSHLLHEAMHADLPAKFVLPPGVRSKDNPMGGGGGSVHKSADPVVRSDWMGSDSVEGGGKVGGSMQDESDDESGSLSSSERQEKLGGDGLLQSQPDSRFKRTKGWAARRAGRQGEQEVESDDDIDRIFYKATSGFASGGSSLAMGVPPETLAALLRSRRRIADKQAESLFAPAGEILPQLRPPDGLPLPDPSLPLHAQVREYLDTLENTDIAEPSLDPLAKQRNRELDMEMQSQQLV